MPGYELSIAQLYLHYSILWPSHPALIFTKYSSISEIPLGHAIPHQTLFVLQFGPDLHGLLPRRPRRHALVPGLHVGEPVELLIVLDHQDDVQSVVPRDECQICKCNFIAYQPSFALQACPQHTADASRLADVAINDREDLFRVEDVEPVSSRLSDGMERRY